MVVTVTALFGICWLTDMIVHVVEYNTTYTIDSNVYTVIHTMILFSSAVNPFVYALINQNFRVKIKRMMSCTGWIAVIHPPTRKTRSCTDAGTAMHPTNTAVPFFRE